MRVSVLLWVGALVACAASVSGARVHHHGVSAAHTAAAVAAPVSEAVYQREFTDFVRKYNKVYPADEFFARYAIFKAKYNAVLAHNADTQRSWSVAINDFSDRTESELRPLRTGVKVTPEQLAAFDAKAEEDAKTAPHTKLTVFASSFDWRAKNAVTEVKNQMQCGSCWSFSTTGALEGAHAIKTGKLVSLSEQELLDCSGHACSGGWPSDAMQWIHDNGGLTTEAAYPYTAVQGPSCNKNGKPEAATLSSVVHVKRQNMDALIAAINVGPVSIALDASGFDSYSGGIYSSPTCGQNLDHAVLIVGYGTENGVDYYIIKNSWGPNWGEKGYIRIKRGGDECGLANTPTYPVV